MRHRNAIIRDVFDLNLDPKTKHVRTATDGRLANVIHVKEKEIQPVIVQIKEEIEIEQPTAVLEPLEIAESVNVPSESVPIVEVQESPQEQHVVFEKVQKKLKTKKQSI